jgi:hypothetical protein
VIAWPGVSSRPARPASFGRESGQGSQAYRDGEPIADVGDGGHTFRERLPGALQIAAL